MVSTIDPNIPATNAPLLSAPIRNNFLAAYNDINGIQAILSGLGNLSTQNQNNVTITGGSINGAALNAGTVPNSALSNSIANTLAGYDNTGAFSGVTIGSGLTLAGGILSAIAGSGTVTSVSVVTANGISGSVANATTTPAITLTLGAITPTSVTASGTVTGSNLSGSNTGDQTTSGTLNRIDVTNGSTNPVIDISSSYVGQASITTLGTIATGIWNGTAITDTYIAAGLDAAKIANGSVSNTVFQYLAGVTSSIQTQINAKLTTVSVDGVTITGNGTPGNPLVATGGGGAVSSVSNADGTLVISPTTGAVVASRAAISGDITISSASNTAAITAGVIVNADVNASAAIDYSKLAALTTGRALVSDGSGFVSVSATTATEIGYVSGVTSSIQTQLNGKQASGNYITALTGDGTASGPGSAALTLATVNSNVGSFGSASSVGTFTVNAKGLITAAGSTSIQIAESQVTNLVSDLAGKQPTGNYITALTGDVTATGPGSVAATLATVNSNTGSFGSSTAIPNFTVNAKGLITAAGTNAVIAPAGTLTGTTLNATVVNSSLTSVGTIATGTWNGTAIGAIYGGTGQTTYALGDTLYSSATNTLSKLAGNTTTTKQYLSQTGTGTVSAAPVWATISGADITGAALTKTDDTNVTLTLGGTPTTALLRATSITAGWTGLLAGSRGGTGVNNGGTLTYGSNNITFTTSGATSVTLPTTGTLATLAGTEIFTNKTGTSSTNAWFTLTTTGTSGAASYTSNTLNIPQYAAAGANSNITSLSGLTGSVASPTDITFAQTASPSYARGKLVYDTSNESLTFFNDDSNVSLQIGQEEWIRVINNSGSSIANGSVVYLNGASGGLPTIALAQSNAAATTIGAGLVTETIANGATGYVTCIGVVRGIDTSAFSAGQTVFISSSVAGGLTATAPVAPNYRYRVGIVGVSSASIGTIHVTPSTAALGNGTANQVFGMNTAGTAQEVKSILGTANEITVTGGTNTITASLPSALTFTGKTITGGAYTGATIDNSAIGATTPSTGAFTNLSANGTVSFTGNNASISGNSPQLVLTENDQGTDEKSWMVFVTGSQFRITARSDAGTPTNPPALAISRVGTAFAGATWATGQTLVAGTTAIAPLTFTSGTSLTTPAAGVMEYDGASFYGTADTTSGRGAICTQQYFRLTANGSAITTIANFFGSTSNISLVSGGYYEIEMDLWFSKSTASTVVFTFTNTAAPTFMNIVVDQGPITGITAAPATALIGGQQGLTTTAPTVTTGSLTTGVNHYFKIRIFLSNNTGTSLKIQATSTSGSLTPLAGSYYKSRRLPANNTGTFAA